MTRRRLAAGIVLGAAVSLLVWAARGRRAADPTRTGPERFLRLDGVSVARTAAGAARLAGSATTNLPDQAVVAIEVRSSERLWEGSAQVSEGRIVLDQTSPGRVTNGRYAVVARYVVEAQPKELREQLHYQPARLETRADLVITGPEERDADLRTSLKQLVAEANGISDRRAIPDLLNRLRAFEDQLWISSLIPASRKLRAALEAAAAAPEPDLGAIRHAALEADALTSF